MIDNVSRLDPDAAGVTVVIDEDRCKGCGLCVTVCPTHSLRMAEGRAQQVAELVQTLEARVAARTAQANEFPATTQRNRETLREP